MAQNVVINGVQYSDVPEIAVRKQGSADEAEYIDTSDATLDNGNKMLDGETAYADGVKYTGSIPSKASTTYTPTTSDQTIQSGQYLSGNQVIKGDQNLLPANIVQNVSIFGVNGAASMPTISQDPVTKILHIS